MLGSSASGSAHEDNPESVYGDMASTAFDRAGGNRPGEVTVTFVAL